MTGSKIDASPTPTIPLPSADLINYRFDQADKRFEEMNRKLDTLLFQNSQFITEDKVQTMIDFTLKPINHTLDSYRRAITLTISGILVSLSTTIIGVWLRLK